MFTSLYNSIRSASRHLDVFEAIFAIKSFVAAMLAMWIAMRIGLDRPYWAVITSYITAQPLAGAVKSKGAFRTVGTIVGTVAAVVIVPAFVNVPEVLSVTLALWLALCAYLSLLDRSPRSYAFALAGYTVAIIGFPSVSTPGTIFTIAALRAQEILLGLSCSIIVHSVVLPTSTLAHTQRRARSILVDTRTWLADALNLSSSGREADRQRLATDLYELHQLVMHLSFDSGFGSRPARTARALLFQLSILLPFIGASEDRLRQLGDGVPEGVERIRVAVVDVLNVRDTDGVDWDALVGRMRVLMPAMRAPLVWRDALLANFIGRLEVIVRAYRSSHSLVEALDSDYLSGPADMPRPKMPTHRDHDVAMRGALSTFFAVLTTCGIWIATAWPDGATAVIFAGVWTILFSNMDDAHPTLLQIMLGTIAGTVLAMIYVGAILPSVTDSVTLIAVLAPAFLMIGALIPRVRTTMFAVGLFNSFPAFLGLNDHFSGTVLAVLNTGIAQIIGTTISIIFLHLLRRPNLHRSLYSLLRLGRRELARRAVGSKVAPLHAWTYSMMDRIAILTPRLSYLGLDPEKIVGALLRDMRAGVSISELRDLRGQLSTWDQRGFDALMRRVAAHLCNESERGRDKLGLSIDAALRRAAGIPDNSTRLKLVVALVGLRRSLLPAASLLPAQ